MTLTRTALCAVLASSLILGTAMCRGDDELLRRIRSGGPVSTSIADLNADNTLKCLELTGVVQDVFTDETNPHYHFFVVRSAAVTFFAALPNYTGDEIPLQRLVGAEVAFCGICDPYRGNPRRLLGSHLFIISTNDIRVVTAAPTDPFAFPGINTLLSRRPHEIPTLGRHKVCGRVLVSWRGDTALVRTTDPPGVSRIEFASSALPALDSFIEAVGQPETDIYNINLSRAIWRPIPPVTMDAEADAAPVDAAEILGPDTTAPRINPRFYGRTIRLRGKVVGRNGDNLLVQSGKHIAPVCDVKDEELEIGAEVEATGVCALDLDNWCPNAAFPRIRGFFLVLRSPADITILRHPPFWTPRRLSFAIGALVLLLLAVLARTRATRIAAAFRFKERTRLAVELHDSLSQNLTGVALEVTAAERDFKADPNRAQHHLILAARTLKSCRDELKYCLWDLRNNTLEEVEISEAIRRTLAPLVGAAKLNVRFPAPRHVFTDNVAHAILRIVRELAVNAVRHGNATAVHVAGSVDGARIRFSVTDNGCGFDPDGRPGITEGHYGLQGVQERIENLEGTMEIASAPGRGTKVTVEIGNGLQN